MCFRGSCVFRYGEADEAGSSQLLGLSIARSKLDAFPSPDEDAVRPNESSLLATYWSESTE